MHEESTNIIFKYMHFHFCLIISWGLLLIHLESRKTVFSQTSLIKISTCTNKQFEMQNMQIRNKK